MIHLFLSNPTSNRGGPGSFFKKIKLHHRRPLSHYYLLLYLISQACLKKGKPQAARKDKREDTGTAYGILYGFMMMVVLYDNATTTTTTSGSGTGSPTYHGGGRGGNRKSSVDATTNASRSTTTASITSSSSTSLTRLKNLIPLLCGIFYICHYSIWTFFFDEGSGYGSGGTSSSSTSSSLSSSSLSCFHFFPHLPPPSLLTNGAEVAALATTATAAGTSTTSSTTTTTNDNSTTTKSKLGDDCYHVFVDVGSNVGVHGRFLLEPYHYPLSRFAVSFFQQQLSNTLEVTIEGNSSNNTISATATTPTTRQYSLEDVRSNVCIFAIEPNPQHTQRQLQLQESYRQMGWKYTYLGVGVSNTNFPGNITFQKRKDDTSPGSLGFTSMLSSTNKENVPENMSIESSVEVPTIRLASWLQEEILGRAIPKYNFTKDDPTVYDQAVNDMLNKKHTATTTATSTLTTTTSNSVASSSTPTRIPPTAIVKPIPPKVIMKLDVEGMEYLLLPDLISSGALCQVVDVIFGEFHYKDKFFPLVDKTTTLQLRTPLDARHYKSQLLQLLKYSKLHCKTSDNIYLNADDETYPNDGIPLPSNNNKTKTI